MRFSGSHSDETGNRPILRRHVFTQVDEDLIDVAPSPTFRRIITLDDRVAGGAEVLGGVFPGDSSQQPTCPQVRQIRGAPRGYRFSGIPRSRVHWGAPF